MVRIPAALIFILSVTTSFCQQTEWLKEINGHAISRAHNGQWEPATPGPALYFSDAGGIKVPYIVHVPKGYDPMRPMPVVVFLHGAILAREEFQYKDPDIANEPIFSVSDPLHCLVVFPFARADFAWGRHEAANENIMRIIEDVEAAYNVDKKRVYIGGISMGGNATYWFAEHKADAFAGFYAFSSMAAGGRGDAALKHITPVKPLYTINAEDDKTFPFNEVKTAYEAKKATVTGWHFNSVPLGGHRFIYGKNGKEYVLQLLGQLLKQ